MSRSILPGISRASVVCAPKSVSNTVSVLAVATLVLGAAACADSTAPVHAAAATTSMSGMITVSPTGLATGAGTRQAPMSLEQAVAMGQSGATIQLLSGTYRTGSLVVSHPVTIQAAPGAHVTLSGSVAIPAGQWQASGRGWRTPWSNTGIPTAAAVGGMSQTSSASATVAALPTTTPEAAQAVSDAQSILTQSLGGPTALAAHRHMAFVDGKSLVRVATPSAVTPGTFAVDTVAKFLYIGQDPSGHTVEASAQAVGLLLYTSNIRVTGLTLSNFSQIGLRIQGTNVQVDHDTMSYNGQIGLDVNGASNAWVHDNVMTYNGEDGMLANVATGVIVEHNNISNNNTGAYSVIASAAGIKVTQMTNFIFRGNWVADNAANAVWIDMNSVNSTIVGNQVLRNTCYGIYVEKSAGILIAGNVVHDNTQGVGVHFTTNASVYNNTLVNNGRALDVSSSYANAPYDLTGAKVVNNILWNSTTSMMENLYRYNGCGIAIYAEVDYNGYYRPSGSVAATAVNYCNAFYPTMTAFHTATGYEAHGVTVDGGTDPFFVNAYSTNYHLKAGSAAIGAGQPLPANIASALGWRAGVAVSMGALQN
jgi:parallel beta-helix repeat protein